MYVSGLVPKIAFPKFLVLISSLITLAPAFFIAEAVIVPFSSLWASLYFGSAVYHVFLISSLLYILPNLQLFADNSSSKSVTTFYSTDGIFLMRLLLTPVVLISVLHMCWCGPSLSAWFGHILFSNFQFKVSFVLFIFFSSYWLIFLPTVHYSTTLIFDYTATSFNFFLWTWVIFFSENIFTFIFFLELLSASITLLVTTSVFSSNHFYSNISFSKHSYFQTSAPTAFLQTLMFFFWITLVTSLSLFLFITLFYTKFLTFDWSLVDSILTYLLLGSSLKALFSLSISWFFLLLSIFLKCGIVPFYLWKPTFFKGLSILTLFFYVYVYYFALFFFFVYVLLFMFNEIFLFNISILIVLVVVATLSLTSLLFESFYLKAFLAMSSILNSLFIMYMAISLQSIDYLFLL